MFHIDAADTRRQIVFNNGNKKNFNIGSIGVYSYINSMDIQLGPDDETANLQIGNYCSIAYNVLALINRNHDYKAITTSSLPFFNFDAKRIKQKGQILIGNDVWIGNNVILLSGIRIGNGAVIGAGTVVSKDIPPYAIAVGNPMKIIKYRFNEEQIKKMQLIQWWNWEVEKIQKNREWFSKNIEEFTDKFYIKKGTINSITLEKNRKSILCIPDFTDPYPVWIKVVKEFIEKFTGSDDITLILRIEQDENFDRNITMVSELLHDNNNLPDILVLNDLVEDERSLFKDIDYFVTTRNINTIKYIEMADEFNVKILSGVDIPIFDKTEIFTDSLLAAGQN